MQKRCGRCLTLQPVSEFHRYHRGDGLQLWCKACRRAYDAAYHQRTKERRAKLKRDRRREFVVWYRGLKEDTPCADCGGIFPPEAMHWDHLPGTTKIDDIGSMQRRSGKRRVLEEIKKCELVCANCHAARTVRRAGRSSAW